MKEWYQKKRQDPEWLRKRRKQNLAWARKRKKDQAAEARREERRRRISVQGNRFGKTLERERTWKEAAEDDQVHSEKWVLLP